MNELNPSKTERAVAVACSDLLGVMVIPKKPVNHLPPSPTISDTCHATQQSSAAQLFSSSLDQETALAGLRDALQQMKRTASELKSNHGCLAVEETHQLFGLRFVCTKYRTPRQLLRKAWRRMVATSSDLHHEKCAPIIRTSRLLLTIVQAVALDSWRVRMTPNVQSSGTRDQPA